jgi:Holliday junction resolvase
MCESVIKYKLEDMIYIKTEQLMVLIIFSETVIIVIKNQENKLFELDLKADHE